MKPLIKLKQAVIVEGKYDKIRLSNIIDSVIITTDGFGIFKSEEKKERLEKLRGELSELRANELQNHQPVKQFRPLPRDVRTRLPCG